MTDLLDTARDAHTNGLCPIPAATNGTKQPWPDGPSWKRYQSERPTPDQLDTWFSGGRYDGLGIVCGAISGNLELFEFEGRAIAEGVARELAEIADASNLGDLWRRVILGYSEQTPSGGIHILYRVDGVVAGNTELARRPSTPEELAAWKAEQQTSINEEPDPDRRARRQERLDRVTRGEQVPQVLAETRGEGGFVVVAPSGGRTHGDIPDGSWTMVTGGFSTIATITPEERDALHHLAGAFDRMPTGQEDARPSGPTVPASPLFSQPAPAYDDDGSVSPGDDYNAKTTWDEILIPLGWTKVYTSGGVTYWCRPGKRIGISATTGRNGADNLYVFSTSTEFESERPYDRFGALALLEYGGNFSAAAKALRAQGYGSERAQPRDDFAGLIAPVSIGNLATVTDIQTKADRAHLQAVSEATIDYSDDGAALQLIDRFGDRIRFCHDRGRWIAWGGVRWEWQPPSGGIVREYAKRIARSMPREDKHDERKKVAALSARGTAAMLTQASTDIRTVVSFDDLDAHPWELNTPGGIVNLKTGELTPADASHLHTRVTLCTPDPAADLTRWHEFLTDTFGEDLALIAYLQRLVGYSATGYIGPHVLPFAFGSGGNGKGVTLEALQAVLGDYATTAPAGFLAASTYAAHETEIARLAGARMVICSETDEDARFDETKVKQLTGGDTLTARFMRQDHFSFQPTHHLWLMANHKPAVRSGGRSFWRRLRLIPFEREVPEAKMVDDLQGILTRDHGPALLAWIVAGAAQFAEHGLMEPDSVKAATNEYEKEQDSIARFIDECCLIGGGPNVTQKVKRVREAYERWCFTEGETPVSAKRLTMELTRRYSVESTQGSKGVRVYTNITVQNDGTDEAPLPSEGWGQ